MFKACPFFQKKSVRTLAENFEKWIKKIFPKYPLAVGYKRFHLGS